MSTAVNAMEDRARAASDDAQGTESHAPAKGSQALVSGSDRSIQLVVVVGYLMPIVAGHQR